MRTPDGWTDFVPSPDTRVVYVSASLGQDSNSGLSPAEPVRTLAAGLSKLRNHHPDWMLLRRGDVWTDENFGYWNRPGGRSAEEPMVIASYGDWSQPRPLVQTGGQSAFKVEGVNSSGSADHRKVSWLCIVGLHLRPHTYNGRATDSWGIRPVGIRWFAGTEGVLVEDCLIEGYSGNITFQDAYGRGINQVTIRRNVIIDAWASDPDPAEGRAQGIYVSGVRGLTIEENFLDHNGWKEIEGDTGPDIFSHNMYIQSNNSGCVVRLNVSSRASSHGLQLRPGGLIEANVFVNDAIAFFNSGGDPEATRLSTDNVVLHGSRRYLRGNSPGPRGFGINGMNQAGAVVRRNIVAHGEPGCRQSIEGLTGVTVEGNVVWRWERSDPGPFPDPERTIPVYDALKGGAGSLESFFTAVRSQRRGNWNPAYTASPMVRYFQEGFGLAEPEGLVPYNPTLEIQPTLRLEADPSVLVLEFRLTGSGVFWVQEASHPSFWTDTLRVVRTGEQTTLERLPGATDDAAFSSSPVPEGVRITYTRSLSSLSDRDPRFFRVAAARPSEP